MTSAPAVDGVISRVCPAPQGDLFRRAAGVLPMTSAPAVENATFAVDHANQTTSFDVTSNSQAADNGQRVFCESVLQTPVNCLMVPSRAINSQSSVHVVASNGHLKGDVIFCKASPCGAVMSWQLPVNSGSAAETSPCGAVMSWQLPVNSDSAAESFV